MSKLPFCTCDDYACKLNPVNHDQGCNLCIEDSLEKKEIPSCFFKIVSPDLSNRTDWSFEGFAELIRK